MKKCDRRVIQTRKLLKDALIRLMKEKPLHQISIKKICETADVNRSTFYHHYDTQYDLYDDILSDVSQGISEIIHSARERDGSTLTVLTELFRYAESERDLFLVILSNNSNLNLGEGFTKNVARFLEKDNNSEMFNYCTQFIAAGIANILWIWLNSENRRSARDVAMVINAMMWYGFKKATMLTGGFPAPRDKNERNEKVSTE